MEAQPESRSCQPHEAIRPRPPSVAGWLLLATARREEKRMRAMLSTLDWSAAGRSSCKMARRQSKDSAFVRFVDVMFLHSIV